MQNAIQIETAKPEPTVRIRLHRLDDARAILNKLADRAFSYGQVISWTEQPYETISRRYRWDGKLIKVTEQWVALFVTGGAPKVGDHTFIAMLERMNGGVLVKAVPDAEVGSSGQDWDGSCDHCGKKRSRVYGYVIESNGVRQIIGQSCVRDYLGMDLPEKMLACLRDITSLNEISDDEDRIGRGSWGHETWGVVAGAIAAVALFGYGKSNMQELSTASRVNVLRGPEREKQTVEEKRLRAEFYERADYYHGEAMKVIEWAREINSHNDYMNNLKVVMRGEVVNDKQMNIAVSVVSAYNNEKARLARIEAAKTAAPSVGYVGELKKRMEAVVTIERIISINNQWGNYRIVLFRTETGSTLKWTTSNDTAILVGDRPAIEGEKVKMAFTPIKHAEYNDMPQTTVNRCKIISAA